MKRKVIDELIKWKAEYSGKPILLTGAKGVGKTYLAYDFAKAFFERIIYVNFERAPGFVDLFHTVDSNADITSLKEYFHIDQEASSESMLLILDEISFCPGIIRILNMIKVSGIFPLILCISSNPLKENVKDLFELLTIGPLEFDEFLLATGNEWYIEAITNHFDSEKKIPEIVHKELLALHQLYLQIGGMPGVVNEYINLSSVINVPEQHDLLISSYHDYIKQCNTESDALKMNQVIDSIPLQLSKENKKFQYKLIRKGTTHAMYRDAISSLSDCDYIIKCNKIISDQLNQLSDLYSSDDWLKNEANFKLYLPDTGLLCTKMIEERLNPLDPENYKALLENYAAQSLQSRGYKLCFWESESMAKIDFIIKKGSNLIPVEIHTSDNTRSKSISIIKQKCDFPYAVKISSKNFEYSNQIKYVPYYAVFCL